MNIEGKKKKKKAKRNLFWVTVFGKTKHGIRQKI